MTCAKCDQPWMPYCGTNATGHKWQRSCKVKGWFCPACVREAYRDARKEFATLTDRHFVSPWYYAEASQKWYDEYWSSLLTGLKMQKRSDDDVDMIDSNDL